MMNLKKLLCMLLALCMMLSVFAFAEDNMDVPAAPGEEATSSEPADENPVIARLRDYTVTLEDVTYYARQLYSEGMIQSETDYSSALDYLLIYVALPSIMVEEMGVENLLGKERMDALYEEAAARYDEEIKNYISYLYGELGEEEYKSTYEFVAAAFSEQGYPKDKYQKDYVNGEAFAAYFDTFTFDISDDEVYNTFVSFVEADKDMFENNIMMYEYYTNYAGYSALYQPAGYRGITHILINADETALAAYADAAAGADDEAVKNAKDAVIESCKDMLDEIYKRIEAGEAFETLIAEYNTDPGMSGDNLKNGYAVHKDTILFMQEFTDGAFSDPMQAVGDVSDPVVTSYGVHILYYLRDIPAGPVEFTEEIRTSMYNYLLYSRQDALLRQWLNDYGVEYTTAYAEFIG